MNHFLNGVARAAAAAFDFPQPILEVGSYQVAGQGELIELRSLFPGRSYEGVDVRHGPGVDRVADVEALPYADASFGTVIAMNTFEHVPRFWRGFDEVHRVLRPDGALLISMPFYFRIHNHPNDYWRFSPTALEVLLQPYPNTIIGWHGPKQRPANVFAVAFREEAPALTSDDYERFRRLLKCHARQPRSMVQMVRYRIGRLLFGQRPFAPYLHLNRWDSVCRSSADLPSSDRKAS